MAPKFKLLLHEKQEAFLNSQARFRCFVAGRGAGKSMIGAYDLAMKASQKSNRLYMVVAPNFPVLRDSSLRSFLRVARKLEILKGTTHGFNKTESRATLLNGSEVVFKSAENPDGLRGPNISGLWVDEAQDVIEEAFNIALGCVREDPVYNWVTATFTPKGRKHWTYTAFAKPDANGNPPADTLVCHCRTLDNPFLPPDYEVNLRKRYTKMMADQELNGEFLELPGTLFQRAWFADKIRFEAPMTGVRARVRAWDKACLVAGTLVATMRGEVPIENVVAGDMVRTRSGWGKVRRAWMTKKVSEAVCVRFDNGSSLTGTLDHPVWTENRGWVDLAALSDGDYAISIPTGGCSWLPRNARWTQFSSRDALTSARKGGDTGKLSDGTKSTSDTGMTRFIGRSGDQSTGKYRKDSTSITSMETSTTTRLRTLNVSRTATTCESIGTSGSRQMMGPLSSPAWSPGQEAKKASKHYRATARKFAAQCRRARSSAPDVESHLREGNCRATRSATARQTVVPGTGEALDFISSGSCVQSVTSGSALNLRTRPVQKSVVSFSGVAVPVYDIEVEWAHEFFANGILVHNSTKDGGCYTAGVLMTSMMDGTYFLEGMIRGQWSTFQRDEIIKLTAELDRIKYGYGGVRIFIEQEPGPIWEEEKVRRADGGNVRLKDVVIGDRVINRYGVATDVEAVHQQGLLDTLKITTRSGREAHAAPSHPFFTPSGWVNAGDLAVGDALFLLPGGQEFLEDMIVQIEPAGLLPCRCLTVGDGASFLVNDLVVHNSSGVDSVQGSIRQLAGHIVRPDKVTGHKRVRAEPLASMCEAKNVYLIENAQLPWVEDFLDEATSFPGGKFQDQVDACSCAYNQLCKGVYALPAGDGGPGGGGGGAQGHAQQALNAAMGRGGPGNAPQSGLIGQPRGGGMGGFGGGFGRGGGLQGPQRGGLR